MATDSFFLINGASLDGEGSATFGKRLTLQAGDVVRLSRPGPAGAEDIQAVAMGVEMNASTNAIVGWISQGVGVGSGGTADIYSCPESTVAHVDIHVCNVNSTSETYSLIVEITSAGGGGGEV
jgi:hypothetical protein